MHNAALAWASFQWGRGHEQRGLGSRRSVELVGRGCDASVHSLAAASEAQFLASKSRERFEHISQYEQQPWQEKRAAPEDQEQSPVNKRIPNEASDQCDHIRRCPFDPYPHSPQLLLEYERL
jgi:hypothetical protein